MVEVMNQLSPSYEDQTHMKREAPNDSKNVTAKHQCLQQKETTKKENKKDTTPHGDAALPSLSALLHSLRHEAICCTDTHINPSKQDSAEDKLQCSSKFHCTFQLPQISKVPRRAS